MPPQISSILQTRLRRPALIAGLIERLRLLERLDAVANCTLTLVVAPAGSGKTSLVSQWLERRVLPAAWLQLDASDSDPALFFAYLVHALRRIAPQFGNETMNLLHSPHLPPAAVIANTLSNEIDEFPLADPWLLVLDDYHLVQNPEIDRALSTLVLLPPRGLHLLVLSRQTPAWPLGRLRLENRLLVLDVGELRFTREETEAYLHLNSVLAPAAELAAQLQRQTEGWAAGLQLALLAMRQKQATQTLSLHNDFLRGADGQDSDYLFDYMADEVLANLPDDLLTFLYVTSLCARFSASLCQALTGIGRERVRGYLHFLEEANLFLIPLGSSANQANMRREQDRHPWYRYHHLMQQTLDSRRQDVLSAAEIVGLHRCAAGWLGEHGYSEDALDHCIAGEDWGGAARLLSGQMDNLLNREDRHTFDRWLARLPKAEIAAHPALMLMQAWSRFFNLDVEGLGHLLADIRQALPAHQDGEWEFDGHYWLLRGIVDYFSGKMDATIAANEQAISLLPPSSAFARNSAYFYLGSAMQLAGRGEDAEEILLQSYRREQPKPGQASARLLFGVATVRLFSGRLTAAYESAGLLLQESRTSHLSLLEGWAHDILGRIDYERNHLAAADEHFAALRERRYAIHRGCAEDGFAGAMLIAAAQGCAGAVAEIGEEWRSFVQSLWELPGPLVDSAQARAALLSGDVRTARRWANGFRAPLGPGPMVWLEISHITKLRCLLASNQAHDLAAAELLAAACMAHVERLRNVPANLALLGLHALRLEACGERKSAVNVLRQALRQAAPEGFVRTFVDLGPRLLNLLGAVEDADLADYIAVLRAAFAPTAAPRPSEQLAKGLAGVLTERELEILALLATPLSAQEIAARLYISYSTVRQHTAHIYEKLGVRKRRHAVLVATEWGLIP